MEENAEPATLKEGKSQIGKSVQELYQCKRLAFDIEIADKDTISCIAFSGDPSKAYVFPTANGQIPRAAIELLQSNVPKLAQNGQFDLYFLRTRCGVEVNNYQDDTIVAWHACFPELAGASQDKKKSKHTRKGLAFLASLYTTDAWYKDYDFEHEEEEYVLCGKDACITLEVMQKLEPVLDAQGARAIYEHQMRLIWPCIAMQERGILIDEEVRSDRLGKLDVRKTEHESELLPLAKRLLEGNRDRVKRPHLFWTQKTCKCCGGGKKKSQACWGCAGFEKAPSKKELVEFIATADWSGASNMEEALNEIYFNSPEKQQARREDFGKWKKSELEASVIHECKTCEGNPKQEVFEFKPTSPHQVKELLYNVLKLPVKMKDGKLCSDEESLKSLLGGLT